MPLAGSFDLHTHSTASDGTEAPADLVAAAARAGLAGIAITDHDTTAGWASARASAERAGIGLLPGIELSTREDWRSVHVLGYLVDPEHPSLVAETARIRLERGVRAERIVERIGADYPITWSDVLARTSPGATIGRPHIADALVALGLEPTRSAAFAGILHWRRGYVEPHYAPSPLEGVRLIVAAGGVPVVAHPGAVERAHVLPESVFAELADAGLFGLEIRHPENSPDGARQAARIARRLGLAETGSSDYHGTGKPNRLGQYTTDAADVAAIIERATGSTPLLP